MGKKYNIIYADPPWQYKDKNKNGSRGAEFKYPCMSISDIKNLPVNELSADNSALFLWVTMPFLPSAFEVINAWGFKYKTCAFTWVKKNKKADSLFQGLGHYTRANPELCLLAIKGKMKAQTHDVHSVVITSIEKHSKKPHEARERIVRLFGNQPRIELFARERCKGWCSWGNEL